MKKVFYLFSSILVALLILPVFNAEASGINDLSQSERQKILAQSRALTIGASIKKAYSPSEYGGMYINKDGQLQVFVLNDYPDLIHSYIPQNVIFKEAKYSLYDLKNAINFARTFALDLKVPFCNLMLDESVNRITIELDKSFNYPQTWVNAIIHNDMFIVKYVENTKINIDYQASVGPGYPVTATGGQNLRSLAFMGRDANGNVGFVTAGHATFVGQMIFSGILSNKMGTTLQFVVGDYADCAFIRRDDPSFTPTRTTHHSRQLIDGVSEIFNIAGATVHLEGATSGHIDGTIISTYGVVAPEHLGRVITSYDSQAGDSGGAMWVGRYIEGTSLWGRYIIGVHNGEYRNPYTGNIVAFDTPADTVMSTLNITPYGW